MFILLCHDSVTSYQAAVLLCFRAPVSAFICERTARLEPGVPHTPPPVQCQGVLDLSHLSSDSSWTYY